jgi:hypothetical protein
MNKGFLQLQQQNNQPLYVGRNWIIVPGTAGISTLYMGGGHFTIQQNAQELNEALLNFFGEHDVGVMRKTA